MFWGRDEFMMLGDNLVRVRGGAPERVIAFLGACRDRGVIWNGVPAAAVAAPPGPCSIFQ